MPYGITQYSFRTAVVTFQPVPQLKLVLDLATPEGTKAELTWVVGIISQESLPAKYGHMTEITVWELSAASPICNYGHE